MKAINSRINNSLNNIQHLFGFIFPFDSCQQSVELKSLVYRSSLVYRIGSNYNDHSQFLLWLRCGKLKKKIQTDCELQLFYNIFDSRNACCWDWTLILKSQQFERNRREKHPLLDTFHRPHFLDVLIDISACEWLIEVTFHVHSSIGEYFQVILS